MCRCCQQMSHAQTYLSTGPRELRGTQWRPTPSPFTDGSQRISSIFRVKPPTPGILYPANGAEMKSGSKATRAFTCCSLSLVVAVNIAFAQDPANSVEQESDNPESADLSFQWRPALLESLLGATLANAERFGNRRRARCTSGGHSSKTICTTSKVSTDGKDGDGDPYQLRRFAPDGRYRFAGFVERQKRSPLQERRRFGSSHRYWTSVMRSLAFSTAYSASAWSRSDHTAKRRSAT